ATGQRTQLAPSWPRLGQALALLSAGLCLGFLPVCRGLGGRLGSGPPGGSFGSLAWAEDQAIENLRVRPDPKFVAPKGYVCFRAGGALTIDGKLDEPAWQQAAWTGDFVDIEGPAKPAPRFRTRARMLWDNEYFYIAAELEEPHAWGTLTEHDAVIFHDNDFEVFVDPDGDCHRYGEFEINALNTGWDLLLPKPYKDGGQADNGWEIPGLKTAIGIEGTLNDPTDTDRRWVVELAFPWKVLGALLPGVEPGQGAPPAEGAQWRVNFSRVEWQHELVGGKYSKVPKQPEDNWVWSPQHTINMHRPETWGVVQFSTARVGTRPAREVRYKPDPLLPIRWQLSRVYYAQQAHRARHGAFATDLTQLDLTRLEDDLLTGPLTLQPRAEGYEVWAPVRLPGGDDVTCVIDHESRFTVRGTNAPPSNDGARQ
ncbi:MAG: sugar-binding protein, partial [Planctomycetaceae bacterium]